MSPKRRGPEVLAGTFRARNRIAERQAVSNTIPANDAPELRQLRRQRYAAALHRLGVRVLAELLAEICRRHPDAATDIDERLAQYTERLTPELLRMTGGDRLPPRPLRAIGGGS